MHFPLIRRIKLEADSVLYEVMLRVFETNEQRVAELADTIDLCFVSRNIAFLFCTQVAVSEESIKKD